MRKEIFQYYIDIERKRKNQKIGAIIVHLRLHYFLFNSKLSVNLNSLKCSQHSKDVKSKIQIQRHFIHLLLK